MIFYSLSKNTNEEVYLRKNLVLICTVQINEIIKIICFVVSVKCLDDGCVIIPLELTGPP